MCSRKDRNKEIKQRILKELNLKASDIGVSGDIDIKIKNPKVSIEAVEKIGELYEHIHRDEFGEILSGGNTFVNVSYDWKIREQYKEKYYSLLRNEAVKLIHARYGISCFVPQLRLNEEGMEYVFGNLQKLAPELGVEYIEYLIGGFTKWDKEIVEAYKDDILKIANQ